MSPHGQVLSEWWKRLVAILIDGAIITIPTMIILAVAGIGTFASVECDFTTGVCTEAPSFLVAYTLTWGLIALLQFAYYTYFNGSEKGQTVGKMVMKIQVRDEQTGGPIGYGKAALRSLVTLALSLFTCGIGSLLDGLWPLWDPKRQALHDKVAGSLVVDAPQ
jgi:uncharacterized RDD family membrane protein YckC